MVATLVRRTAKELAAAFYDNEDVFRDGRHMRTERFRSMVGTQREFKNEYWTDFVPLARKILAHMLNESGRPQSQKDEIYDALLKDRRFQTDTDIAAPSIMRLN